jgi:hypothetical protein
MREEGGQLRTQWNVDKERRTLTEAQSIQRDHKVTPIPIQQKSAAFNLMKTGPCGLTAEICVRHLLVPGQARSKNCPFSSGRWDFSLPPLGS